MFDLADDASRMLHGASFTSQLHGAHYLQNTSDDFNLGPNKCRPKFTFKSPEYLQYRIKLRRSPRTLSFLYGANSSRDTA